MILSREKTITATEVILTQLLSYNVSKHNKNKNENTEYHDMFISFNSHIYSKQRSPFFPVWVMEFSIISSGLSKVKVFPITLTR